MESGKYDCKRCGRPFALKEDEKEPQCVHCGSKDVAPQPERPRAPSVCGPRGRFT